MWVGRMVMKFWLMTASISVNPKSFGLISKISGIISSANYNIKDWGDNMSPLKTEALQKYSVWHQFFFLYILIIDNN
jgi:hypothetical protein